VPPYVAPMSTQRPLRIALLCEESAGAQTLRMLAAGPHRIAALLTSAPRTDGKSGAVWRLAEELGYEPIPAEAVREAGFARRLAGLDIDLILNIHSLHIVPPAVLRVPCFGAYNLHPGPLPAFAGLNAPSWAIFLGKAQHAVTLHRMEPGIDTGPIAYQQSFPIDLNDTGLSVALRCVQKGLPLVARLLEIISAERRVPPLAAQDSAQRSYFGRNPPYTGLLSWNQPARRIYDLVRACDYHPFASPWGAPRALLADREVEVLKTELTAQACKAPPGTVRFEEQPWVATADEWLRLRRLRPRPTSSASNP